MLQIWFLNVVEIHHVDSEGGQPWGFGRLFQFGATFPPLLSSQTFEDLKWSPLLPLRGGLCGAHFQSHFTSVSESVVKDKK